MAPGENESNTPALEGKIQTMHLRYKSPWPPSQPASLLGDGQDVS